MDMGLMTTISLLLMLAIFVIGTARNINLGILGFVASLILGYFLNGVSFGTILEGINTELLVILIGVTFFFNWRIEINQRTHSSDSVVHVFA